MVPNGNVHVIRNIHNVMHKKFASTGQRTFVNLDVFLLFFGFLQKGCMCNSP